MQVVEVAYLLLSCIMPCFFLFCLSLKLVALFLCCIFRRLKLTKDYLGFGQFCKSLKDRKECLQCVAAFAHFIIFLSKLRHPLGNPCNVHIKCASSKPLYRKPALTRSANESQYRNPSRDVLFKAISNSIDQSRHTC